MDQEKNQIPVIIIKIWHLRLVLIIENCTFDD